MNQDEIINELLKIKRKQVGLEQQMARLIGEIRKNKGGEN